jgi:hypothetical protein
MCSPALFAGDIGAGGTGGGASYSAMASHELAFVAEQLQRGGHNGSAWNYLRGLLTLPGGGDAWLHDERLPQLCCQVDACRCLSVCKHVVAADRHQLQVRTERWHTVRLHLYFCCAPTLSNDVGAALQLPESVCMQMYSCLMCDLCSGRSWQRSHHALALWSCWLTCMPPAQQALQTSRMLKQSWPPQRVLQRSGGSWRWLTLCAGASGTAVQQRFRKGVPPYGSDDHDRLLNQVAGCRLQVAGCTAVGVRGRSFAGFWQLCCLRANLRCTLLLQRALTCTTDLATLASRRRRDTGPPRMSIYATSSGHCRISTDSPTGSSAMAYQ